MWPRSHRHWGWARELAGGVTKAVSHNASGGGPRRSLGCLKAQGPPMVSVLFKIMTSSHWFCGKHIEQRAFPASLKIIPYASLSFFFGIVSYMVVQAGLELTELYSPAPLS